MPDNAGQTTQDKAEHVIGIIGVRDFKERVYDNTPYIRDTLESHVQNNVRRSFRYVTGGSKGVESLVVDIAEQQGIPLRKIPPNIQLYGPQKAFIVRNATIVSECSELVVFWDGNTKAILDAFAASMLAGRRVTIYPLV